MKEEETVFGDITVLLEEQFMRLGNPEQEVMYWLAIEREAISVIELRAKMLTTDIKGTLLDIVKSLLRCSLIELLDDGRLMLQPVVMEYISRRLGEGIAEEIARERVALFDRLPLMEAEAKDYVN